MLLFILLVLVGSLILIVSTDQFVAGAERIAESHHLSTVLVGAVILGCGVGLPELALAFHRHNFSWKQILDGVGGGGGGGHIGFFILILLLVIALSLPAILPNTIQRHSPLILLATVAFASLLRGSLNRYEGCAMIVGFAIGLCWIILSTPNEQRDPFAPLINDDYHHNGAYVEGPVMTPLQLDSTRIMIGLVGAAVGAQILAVSIGNIFKGIGLNALVVGAFVATFASVTPHVVVAFQALKRENERLAVGNMIGSNLFQSLVIGGLVAVIKPYELGGSLDFRWLGAMVATALLTYMLLKTEEEMPMRQGLAIMASYVGLVVFTVL